MMSNTGSLEPSRPLRRFTLAVLALVLGALGVLSPTAAHGEDPAAGFRFDRKYRVFFGDSGKAALVLSPEDTDAAAGMDAHSPDDEAAYICQTGVAWMIQQAGSYSMALCGTGVSDCSARASAVQRAAGITFATDPDRGGTYACWSYDAANENIVAAPRYINVWRPSPTENFEQYNLHGLLTGTPVVDPYLDYTDTDGQLRRTYLFYDSFIGGEAQSNLLTFRDANGKSWAAWRSGREFIAGVFGKALVSTVDLFQQTHSWAPDEASILAPEICLRASLCTRTSMLQFVGPYGWCYAKIQ